MANYNKSFNFRNGVQVDNDNFIVNANGLVGIGTTIPKEYLLNVYGDTRVTGLITVSQLSVDNADVESLTTNEIISAGVITATSFSGDASGLTGIFAVAVDGWYISGGNISTTSNVGIGTTLPVGNLQVGSGVTINNDGNATYAGIVTATEFVGIGSNITQIDASNISYGTLSNSRLPADINVSGVVTASSFVGNLTGTATSLSDAANIITGTISPDRLSGTYDISITGSVSGDTIGVGTATIDNDLTVGTGISITSDGNIYATGIVTATEFVGNVTGNVTGTASTAQSLTGTPSIIVDDITGSNLNVSGIVTSTGGFVGDVTGTASTAQSLTGNPSITVNDITGSNLNLSGIVTASDSLNVGSGGLVFSALSNGNVGIGTAVPTSELQIRKESDSLLEVISNSGTSRISIGQSVGVGKSTSSLEFGNSPHTFDIINHDTGNVNFYLHAGSPGVGTGNFSWIYGQINNELATLTYEGKFGIGITDPSDNLHVVGTSTVTGNSYFGSDVIISGSLSASVINLPDILGVNINPTAGVSTVKSLHIDGGINRLGIGTDNPLVGVDARNQTAIFQSVGVNTDQTVYDLTVDGGIFSRIYYGNFLNVNNISTGIVTATNGFTSGSGDPVSITVVGNSLTFTVAGIGSTTLTLF